MIYISIVARPRFSCYRQSGKAPMEHDAALYNTLPKF